MERANKNLNDTSRKVIEDLIDDMKTLLAKDSNIAVIWGLERLHNENALMKSADHIRKSLNRP